MTSSRGRAVRVCGGRASGLCRTSATSVGGNNLLVVRSTGRPGRAGHSRLQDWSARPGGRRRCKTLSGRRRRCAVALPPVGQRSSCTPGRSSVHAMAPAAAPVDAVGAAAARSRCQTIADCRTTADLDRPVRCSHVGHVLT